MSRASERPRSSVYPSVAGRLVGAAVVAVLFMGSTLLTPLYELYRARYGFSSFVLVLLYSVYVIGNLAALLFFGRLSDQIGRKPMVFAALALAIVSAAIFFLADALPWLFVARIVSGLAVGIGSGAATAWITEFTAPERRPRSASLMTAFNFIGLALGPLLAGVLVEHAPHPVRVPFAFYAGILLATALFVAAQPETVIDRMPATFAPRLGLPPKVRTAFIAPAASGFAAMAVVGFFAALGPTTIRGDIGLANRAFASAIVAELFVVAAILIFATQRLAARSLMLIGLSATPIGMALLVLAQRHGSLELLLSGNAVCGIAGAFGYRGGLAVTNALAPVERRAEVASAFFICCFCGNAIPIIGVGALAQAVDAHFADLVFAGVVTAIALLALAAAYVFTPVSRPTDRVAG